MLTVFYLINITINDNINEINVYCVGVNCIFFLKD